MCVCVFHKTSYLNEEVNCTEPFPSFSIPCFSLYYFHIIDIKGIEHPLCVLSGRVSHSRSGDRRVLLLRKLSTARIWQHDKTTDDNKIILSYVRKLMKNK